MNFTFTFTFNTFISVNTEISLYQFKTLLSFVLEFLLEVYLKTTGDVVGRQPMMLVGRGQNIGCYTQER